MMKKRNLSLTLLHDRRKVGCREKNGINFAEKTGEKLSFLSYSERV